MPKPTPIYLGFSAKLIWRRTMKSLLRLIRDAEVRALLSVADCGLLSKTLTSPSPICRDRK
jgi:hypothetical protein